MKKSTSFLSCVLLSAVLLVMLGQPRKAAAKPNATFSDAAVKAAIAKGVKFLWSQQQGNSGWAGYKDVYPTGPGAMAIYALLESGVSPQEPKMKKALAWLKETPEHKIYCLGMRANAWEVANRTTNDKYKDILRKDVALVINSTQDGSFHYDADGSPKAGGDNSTSQFGLLAMWAGSLNDLRIRNGAWKLSMKWWMDNQTSEGGWDYRGKKANRPTMTAAGIASMYVCVDNLYARTFVTKPARAEDFPALMTIQKAINRLDRTFNQWHARFGSGYYMYGIERVGLACGYKYFNGKDWYKKGAIALLKSQSPDGSWGEVYNTAFCMLFLIRGQHPVLFNKLRYNGDWNNRPRDLASLTRWMSKGYERALNWQIVDLKMPIRDWHDAPILVITGTKEPAFSEADIKKLRTFVLQGGTILSVAESTFSSKPFDTAMRKFYEQMFPTKKLTALPKEHELYKNKVYYNLPAHELKFEVVSNGVRPMIIHTNKDIIGSWQGGAVGKKTEGHFKAATNIAKYVAGQLKSLRNRGVSHWPVARGGAVSKTIRISRVKHSGNWNPEPMADQALVIKMKNRAKVKLEIGEAVTMTDLPGAGVKFALMTGTDAVTFTDAEMAGLKKFVQGGGTILIDVAGGNGRYGEAKPFARSVRDALKKAFPGRRNRPRQLASSSPLYSMEGNVIESVKYRQHTKLKMTDKKNPLIRAIMVGGRPGVLFSGMDLTAGMVGYPSLVVDGYTPDSAFKLMRNIILYSNK
ncbi:MAG: DUF4159 domain-containing protein [bacterium]|nr:DUF4159 domain-containing protein [bacterium]